MSQENLEIVRRAYGALRRRDWDALSRDAHGDFVIHTQQQGSYRGPDAARRFVDDRTGSLQGWTLEPRSFLDRDDRVTVFLRSRARLRDSSTEIVLDIAHVWTLRDRALVSLHTFARQADAFRAAGLRE
jgi:ketosteroid isomerase-like protein